MEPRSLGGHRLRGKNSAVDLAECGGLGGSIDSTPEAASREARSESSSTIGSSSESFVGHRIEGRKRTKLLRSMERAPTDWWENVTIKSPISDSILFRYRTSKTMGTQETGPPPHTLIPCEQSGGSNKRCDDVGSITKIPFTLRIRDSERAPLPFGAGFSRGS